jgi:hypothetical protein
MVVLAAVALAAIACEKQGGEASGSARKAATGYAPAPPMVADTFGIGAANQGLAARVAAPSPMRAEIANESAASGVPDQLPPGATNIASSAMVIRTGTATIKVDSLDPAVVRLRALAVSVGGYVGNTSMQTGTDQLRSATVEIKVPAARWGQLVTGLKPIGTLEAVEENAEDVGEEFVDVQARVANAKRLEARLIDLLANRTGKLSDALQVERELARVREEIERYEGRIRYLQTQAAMSTMTVTLHEPAPVLGSHPGDNPIAQAFRDAWRAFVGVIAFLIASLGVLLPLAVIGWVVWLGWRRWGRKARGEASK